MLGVYFRGLEAEINDEIITNFMKIRYLLLFVLIGIFSVFGIGQNLGKLKGKVLDNKQRPIISTRIIVFNAHNKFTVITNDVSGKYEINLPSGKYTVRIKARPGFAQFTRLGVFVRRGKTKKLNIFPEARIYVD